MVIEVGYWHPESETLCSEHIILWDDCLHSPMPWGRLELIGSCLSTVTVLSTTVCYMIVFGMHVLDFRALADIARFDD